MTAMPILLARRRMPRRRVLHVYTAVEIVVGSLVLAWAILSQPIMPAISLGGSQQPVMLVGGVVFWSAFCLVGGTRVGSIHGYGVLTFHMPFILAAAALGGPAAGGAVAFLGTLELRELRDPPWYGLLANHSALALSGVAAGLVMAAATAWLAPFGLGADATALGAFVAGAVAFVLLSVSLAAGTSMIRDSAEALEAYTGAFRATMVTEVIVGWLLALLYGGVAPWAAVLGGVVVLQLIRLLGEREFVDRDRAVPRLLRYEAFQEKTETVAHVLPVGYLIIKVEGWATYVQTRGREAAETLTRPVGEAIAEALFTRDAATRSDAGEWRVLLVGSRAEGVMTAARKHSRAVSRALAAATIGAPGLTVRIGGGVADDVDRGDKQVTSRAEQAIFHARRQLVAVAIKDEDGWTTWNP